MTWRRSPRAGFLASVPWLPSRLLHWAESGAWSNVSKRGVALWGTGCPARDDYFAADFDSIYDTATNTSKWHRLWRCPRKGPSSKLRCAWMLPVAIMNAVTSLSQFQTSTVSAGAVRVGKCCRCLRSRQGNDATCVASTSGSSAHDRANIAD